MAPCVNNGSVFYNCKNVVVCIGIPAGCNVGCCGDGRNIVSGVTANVCKVASCINKAAAYRNCTDSTICNGIPVGPIASRCVDCGNIVSGKAAYKSKISSYINSVAAYSDCVNITATTAYIRIPLMQAAVFIDAGKMVACFSFNICKGTAYIPSPASVRN